jgi:hypothetical protein
MKLNKPYTTNRWQLPLVGGVENSSIIAIVEPNDPLGMSVVQALLTQLECRIEIVTTRVSSSIHSINLVEKLYRYLDCRVFDGANFRRDTLDNTLERSNLPTVIRQANSSVILNFTDASPSSFLTQVGPTLSITFEGWRLKDLVEAVRSRLGVFQGTLRVCCYLEAQNGPHRIYEADCFIDHRSLTRSVELLIQKIPMIFLGALRRFSKLGQLDESSENNRPTQVTRSASRQIASVFKSISQRLLYRDRWRIVLYRNTTRHALQCPWVCLEPDRRSFWADPFLIEHDHGVVVLFEDLSFSNGRGRISMVNVDYNGNSSAPMVVLEKPWHLSYPFTFNFDETWYMIPESSGHRTVDLYKCVEFPSGWSYVSTLISGYRLADASIINWNGRWWMFAAHGGPGASIYDELHIFWAHDLLGPWHQHSLNPVKIDAGAARPAGRLFVENGYLIRPTQDCRNRYGDGVIFHEVVELTEERFTERVIDRLIVKSEATSGPIHTYNASGCYAVVDIVEPALRW